jgi:hypothetical protein
VSEVALPPGLQENKLTLEEAETIRRLLDDPNEPRHEGVPLPSISQEEFVMILDRKQSAEFRRRYPFCFEEGK